MTISIYIAKADQYTFRQHEGLQGEGHSVLRSPHFTNQGLAIANLGIAAMGLDVVGYDWGWVTPGGRLLDKNNPLKLGRQRLVQEPLVTKIEASIGFERSAGIQSLSEYHAGVLNDAFGLGNVQTMTALARSNRSMYESVVAVAMDNNEVRATFKEGVDINGERLPNYFLRYPERLQPDAVYGVTDKNEGVRAHVPIPIVLAALFAMQAHSAGKDTVFHLAGSDMLKYIESYRSPATGVLAELACRGYLDDSLKVVLIPSAQTQIIAKTALTEEYEAYMECIARLQGDDRKGALKELNQHFNSLRER